jgi:hypothetical protein
MRQTDREETRNPDRGIGAGDAQLKDDQRDVEQEVGHMPRHWQAPGARGEEGGLPPPSPDMREPGRGNQYGEAGEVASDQVQESLPEQDGRSPAPQTRDNEQLPKRPGERSTDLPTPKEAQ